MERIRAYGVPSTFRRKNGTGTAHGILTPFMPIFRRGKIISSISRTTPSHWGPPNGRVDGLRSQLSEPFIGLNDSNGGEGSGPRRLPIRGHELGNSAHRNGAVSGDIPDRWFSTG